VTNTNVATSIVSANVKTASDHFPIFADIKF
jgi:endonuclease/exonuclease/phosphatase family metal-dependent hydrolase